jgi:phthalate 4,5-dioxygenase
MLTKAENELLTQTGRDTPCGELMRRYWQPVALGAELAQDTPLPVRVLGEDLVLFRDERGRPALIERWCPHRGTDLSYGRLEDGGLRCIYHGWLFGPNGSCLEQPAEPARSTFKDRIKHRGYPCREAGGLVLAYLGPDKPPPLPLIPFLQVDRSHVFVTKRLNECNYLQANDIDPSHLSFLHRFYDESIVRGDSNQYFKRDVAPEAVLEATPFGLRAYASRDAGNDEVYVRITNFVMPNMQAYVGPPLANPKVERPSDDHGYWMHWHVPIDDVTHWKYVIGYRADAPIDQAYQAAFFEGEVDAEFRPLRNKRNRFLQDRSQMTRTFAGVGGSFQDQDRLAVESGGPITDRTREHLGVADRPTIEQRKLVFRAIEDVRAGRDPLALGRDGTNPFEELVTTSVRLPRGADVRGFWRREPVASA